MSLEPDFAAKQPNMPKVFLSYARDDSAKAQSLVKALEAQVMAQWGKRDEAIEFLERALALRDAGLVRIKNDPSLDPLRRDSRFAAIERKIGFA